MESVAGMKWNGWPASRGITGRLGLEYADPQVKEGKQAEFLIHDVCPWHLVEKICVLDERMQAEVNTILQPGQNKPIVSIERTWYY